LSVSDFANNGATTQIISFIQKITTPSFLKKMYQEKCLIHENIDKVETYYFRIEEVVAGTDPAGAGFVRKHPS
jgi:hypothetical protein